MPTRSGPKLAINLIQLLPDRSGGIETYARELLPRLLDTLPDWRVTVFVNAEGFDRYRSWDDRCEWHRVGLSWFDRWKRLTYETTVLPRLVRAGRFDLLHNMVNTACLRPGCPQLTTICDATAQLYPPAGESWPSKVFRRLLAWSVSRSDAIVTLSASAARDLVRAYGLDESDLHVISLAARPPARRLDVASVFAALGLAAPERYFVTPGARRPHKNIERLLAAFAGLPASTSAPHLLLPGTDAGGDARLRQLTAERGIEERVHLLDWISDEQLDTLYANAVALVFPSLAEGFGLPLLEAMQCGCPVAASGVTSMPEIGGDAAVYFDPTDEQDMMHAMQRLLDDSSLRARLRSAGLRQAAKFSWERTAAETAALYEAMLRG